MGLAPALAASAADAINSGVISRPHRRTSAEDALMGVGATAPKPILTLRQTRPLPSKDTTDATPRVAMSIAPLGLCFM